MHRARARVSVHLQDRDIAILRGLFESRIMSLEHVSALYFAGRAEAAKKRLQKLKAAGLVAERPRRTFEPGVLYLKRPAIALLHERGILHEYPPFDLPALERRARVSDATIRHELAVMDAKAALSSAIRTIQTLSVVEFTTWPLLIQFDIDGTLVKPDGFIRLRESNQDERVSEHCFFLEVDRSTETHETLVSRIRCYVDHYKSGGFAVSQGALREEYWKHRFRVLVVFKSTERRDNFAERLLQAKTPALSQIWLSTLDDLKCEPLGAIWIQPADYRGSANETRGSSPNGHQSPKRGSGLQRRRLID